MKARLKRGWSRTYPELTVGNSYRVLGVEGDDFRILSDAGEPILFCSRAFEILDRTLPTTWVREDDLDGRVWAYPRELSEPRNFFERYFDYDVSARQQLHLYVHQLCHLEGADAPPPPNRYLRVESRQPSEDPTAIYLELDDERLEVRRIEVFRDGRITYADGKGGSGPTELASRPRTTEDLMTPVVSIERAEFEALWNLALERDTK